MRELTTRQKEIATGLAIIVMVGGGLLAGEAALRLIQLARFGVARTVESSSAFYIDKESGLRMPRPNQQLGRIRINNLGFRGPDLDLEKPGSTCRIAFLGSSTTYDANAGEGENWPDQTAQLIGASLAGCAVDFVNAGVPGYSTAQMLRYYAARVDRLNPDLVVILPGDLEHDLDELAARRGFTIHRPQSSWLSRHSVLYAKMEKNIRIVRLQRAAFSHKGKLEAKPGEVTPAFEARLRQLVGLLVQQQRLVALVTISGQLRRGQTREQQVRAANTSLFYMPYMSIPDLLDMRDGYNDVIRRVAQESSVLLIDVAERIPGDRDYYADTAHFTAMGSREMARIVADALLAYRPLQTMLQQGGCSISPRQEVPLPENTAPGKS
jgi:lysophospholipase L1-like esterase